MDGKKGKLSNKHDGIRPRSEEGERKVYKGREEWEVKEQMQEE